jgi:hypothetical protein
MLSNPVFGGWVIGPGLNGGYETAVIKAAVIKTADKGRVADWGSDDGG